MKLIDINLTVKGPQGCGKMRFIEHMLPIIAEDAEQHFEGMSHDLMVTATEEQVPVVDATHEDRISALRFAEAMRLGAQKKMNELLKELGVDSNLIEEMEKLSEACATSTKRMIEISKELLKTQTGENDG